MDAPRPHTQHHAGSEQNGRSHPPAAMTLAKHRYSDLDTVIDCLHELFEVWEEEEAFAEFDAEVLHRARLAIHEWVANLVQHADFAGRTPEVLLEVRRDGEKVLCAIEDNSEGFDFDAHLGDREEILESYPERGMGLLMLKACTKELLYCHTGGSHNRLEFSVTGGEDPWLKIPF